MIYTFSAAVITCILCIYVCKAQAGTYGPHIMYISDIPYVESSNFMQFRETLFLDVDWYMVWLRDVGCGIQFCCEKVQDCSPLVYSIVQLDIHMYMYNVSLPQYEIHCIYNIYMYTRVG